jgi:hypothetical protein
MYQTKAAWEGPERQVSKNKPEQFSMKAEKTILPGGDKNGGRALWVEH